jgi:hypothetical protein
MINQYNIYYYMDDLFEEYNNGNINYFYYQI